MKRTTFVAVILGCLAGAGGGVAQGGPVGEDWSRTPGGLLPLQDRVGNPRIAAVVEDTLRRSLADSHTLVDPARLRDAQRRLRLRDTSRAASAALAGLRELTTAGWLFSATLHQATENRPSRASRAYLDIGPPGEVTSEGDKRQPAREGDRHNVPQIVLSGRVVRLSGGDPTLGWAGFEAASGLDRRRLLGLGVVADPELLAGEVARRLIEAFERDLARSVGPAPGERTTAWRGARPARGGYLRRPIGAGGKVAVVPFHSVTERDATVAGDTLTQLALAVLYRSGFDLTLPGLVNEIQRRPRGGARATLSRGEVDAEMRADLAHSGADLIMTGTVETWEVLRRGAEPEPRVGFSARLLDADSGAILWWNGQDRRGWDRSRTLGIGRVHAAGALAEEMMESLVASFLARGGTG